MVVAPGVSIGNRRPFHTFHAAPHTFLSSRSKVSTVDGEPRGLGFDYHSAPVFRVLS